MPNRRAWLLAWTGLLASTGPVSAQWTTDRWVSLVEMPVAVTRLEVAGVPLADLRLFVPALNVTQVQPTLFLETVRGVPVMQHYYVLDEYDGGAGGAHPANHGGYVQYLLSRGLRGTALADAIHQDLRTRGVRYDVSDSRRVDVLHPGYLLLPANGSQGLGRGRGQGGQDGVGARQGGSSDGTGRARSLGDDLRARKGASGNDRPTLEPRGRGSSSFSPGNPGRGGGAEPAAGRGRGNGNPGGGSASGGGRGPGGGGGGGRGRGG